jgi:hypothetical protein
LRALFDPDAQQTNWGISQQITMGGLPVFIKRIPVTQIEYEHLLSTKNLYDLPLFYQYGFGSVGWGVFRELLTHLKTTHWVIAGDIENFPLLYHYRLLPAAGPRAAVDIAYHKRTLTYWGDNEQIGRYMLERARADYELVLCLECFPQTVAGWLMSHPDQTPLVLKEITAALKFLQNHGLIHFDVHLFNMLTDGQQIYLTDFGLTLDKQFSLSAAEAKFYDDHSDYDYGQLLWSLGTHLYATYRDLPPPEKQQVQNACGINEEMVFEQSLDLLLTHFDTLAASGLMNLATNFVAIIAQYRPVITLMHDFYRTMRGNDQKDTPFPRAALKQLLQESGFAR